MRRIIDCRCSDFLNMTRSDLLDSIASCEGRTVCCETVGALQPMLGDVTNAEFAAAMGADTDPFYGAPTVVVVLSDPEIRTYLHDGALVMGNLMNAAHAVGVDSCYIFRAKEMFESEEGKALLRQWGIPERFVGIGNCILGYGAEGGKRPLTPRKEGYIIKV